jgi:hypothetical protein
MAAPPGSTQHFPVSLISSKEWSVSIDGTVHIRANGIIRDRGVSLPSSKHVRSIAGGTALRSSLVSGKKARAQRPLTGLSSRDYFNTAA